MSHPHSSVSALIRFVRDRSPFYRDLYRDLPDDWATLEGLPPVRQEEFWAANGLQDNRLLTGPMEDGIILKSGGTTGEPKFSVFSRAEWAEFTRTFGAKLALNGLVQGDRVANLFHVGDLYGSFLFTHQVLEACPVRLIQLPVAGVTPLSNMASIIREYGATVVAGLPTTLLSLADQFHSYSDRSSVKTILFAGEPMQKDQRDRMSQTFPGAAIRSIGYASTDAGLLGYADVGCGPNEFRCYDGEAVYEILDEVSGNPITQPGQEGIAVVTGLKRSLMPVIRYPVGDRAQWVEPAGTRDRKFLLMGRSEDAARIGPVSFQLGEVRSVLDGFSDRLGAFQFQLVVVHRDTRDGLVVRIGSRIQPAGRAPCEREIIAALHRKSPLYREFAEQGKVHALEIEWREPSALEVSPRTGKMKRVIDLRARGV